MSKIKCSPAAEKYARANGHDSCFDNPHVMWCQEVSDYNKTHPVLAWDDSRIKDGAVVNLSRDYTITGIEGVFNPDTEISTTTLKSWLNDHHFTGQITLVSEAPVDPRIAKIVAAGEEVKLFWEEADAKDILDAFIREGLIK